MSARKSISAPIVIALATGIALPVPALAQAQSAPARGGTLSTYEAGYANGRQMEGRTYASPSRDQNGNRLIVNGIIQSDSSSFFESDRNMGDQTQSGADYFSSGAASYSSTAIGNLLTVSVQGSWNTVIVNSTQSNTGTVSTNAPPSPPR
jgi:holdfast attachment protein HfaA